MNFFCFLWMPLFYFFWISLRPPTAANSGGVGALLLGSACALVRYITAPWISPGEFGFSRWLSTLVDTVSLPALLPLLFFALFSALNIIPAPGDPVGFALLWLVPEGMFRSLNPAGRRDPVFLTLVPVLWTAIALGIPLFARFLSNRKRRFRMALALFGITALPLAAASCYWAFFCRRLPLGWVLLAATLMPPVLSLRAHCASRIK